jgi:hypothetical protein
MKRRVYIETTVVSYPIVEEVRKHRMEHTRKFHGDLGAICEDLRAIQRASGHTVVRLPPRKVPPRTQAKTSH